MLPQRSSENKSSRTGIIFEEWFQEHGAVAEKALMRKLYFLFLLLIGLDAAPGEKSASVTEPHVTRLFTISMELSFIEIDNDACRPHRGSCGTSIWGRAKHSCMPHSSLNAHSRAREGWARLLWVSCKATPRETSRSTKKSMSARSTTKDQR
jgi:hypothetical protein